MKADLHVHSYHSGYATHLPFLRARDCYSSPADVYRVAKARGMDLVCLTDHDTLDGCLEFLDANPDAADFIIGEEIGCRFPDVPGLRVHLGAIDMTERVHREIQPLRSNVFEAAACLRRENVFFSVNHLFLFFRDQIPLEDYVRLVLELSPGLETHNGAMLASHNEFIAHIAASSRGSGHALVRTGGSDAHTLRWVGTAYTETPGGTREEFLRNLRTGHARTGGLHGSRWRMASEIYGIIFNYWRALVGVERHDLGPATRLAMGALSTLSLPLQWLPGLMTLAMKGGEARRIRRYRDRWAGHGTVQPVIQVRSPSK